jgi:hypothetical protein
MFVLGHVGLGRAVARPWIRALPIVVFAIGTLLPDIVDKSLYYSHLLGQMPATRMYGHTGVLLLALAGAAALARSRVLAALAAGMATHLAFDCLLDFTATGPKGAWIAAVWPLAGPFPAVSIPSIAAHLKRITVGPVIICEILGGLFIAWELWNARRPRRTHRAAR